MVKNIKQISEKNVKEGSLAVLDFNCIHSSNSESNLVLANRGKRGETFIKCLVSAKYCVKYWGYKQKIKTMPSLQELTF